MESDIYKKVLEANQQMFDQNAHSYNLRVKDAHQRYLLPFVQHFVQALKGECVLDLGCGTGRELLYFQEQGLDALGIDCSKEMIHYCLCKGLKAEQQDFLSYSPPLGVLDGVWSYTAFTLVPKETFIEVLAKVTKWLKPGVGILALGLTEGQRQGWTVDDSYQMPKYCARYTIEQLKEMILPYFDIFYLERVVDPTKPGKFFIHLLARNNLRHD
jgi:SAM-dependent methyltransferase